MYTFGVTTDIIQSHFIFSSPSLCLEEYSISGAAAGTRVVICAGQCWVLHDLWTDVTQFINFMHQFVDIDAIVIRWHLVVTITAGIQQYFVLLVLFGVQHVVTLLAETDPNESRPLGTYFALTHGCSCCVYVNQGSSKVC